jgi:hypothetical protein
MALLDLHYTAQVHTQGGQFFERKTHKDWVGFKNI